MDHNQASVFDYKEVARALKTDPQNGLSSFEARDRLKQFGANSLDDDDHLFSLANLNLNSNNNNSNSNNNNNNNKGDPMDTMRALPRFLVHNLLLYLSQYNNPLIQLLLICALISAAIGEFGSAISVAVSVLIVSTISYVQERRADLSLEKLNKQMPNLCKVIRERQIHEIESKCLVPGDIVHLSEGQRVPADLRLFGLHSLSINEANLTGETQSQIKSQEPIAKRIAGVLSGKINLIPPACQVAKEKQQLFNENPHLTPAAIVELAASNNNNSNNNNNNDDHKNDDGGGVGANFISANLALMGTLVESGHARGIVIATGKSTRYGEVFCLLKGTVQPRSPLQVNIDQLSMHLVIVSCIIIASVAVLGIVQQRPGLDVLYYALSLAVTAIPEGLPVVVAVIMALGVLRLSRKQAVVRSLNSIETLGCIRVLCADKTGTLTRDDMTLTDIVTSELHSLSNAELDEMNSEECKKQMTFNTFGGKMFSIGRLMEVGTLCNNASLDPTCVGAGTHDTDANSRLPTAPPAGARNPHRFLNKNRYLGQATECALLDAALRMGFGDSRTKFSRLQEQPFSASTRRMAVLCQRDDLPGNSPMYYVKGAWEEILQDCCNYYECGLVRPRTNEMWLEYARICTALGSQGLRVLALATGPSLNQLTFVGIVGINNAPRDGVGDTVVQLRRHFEIDVKMITGDSRPTAVAIGRAINLFDSLPGDEPLDEAKHIMSGEQVEKLLDSELDEFSKACEINSKAIFYRVDPIQKANIINRIQQLDKIVAMTGDGVNDVISMKRANLSLVMGSGADVCKEMADVVLVDDNLNVLVDAVLEGKGIYHKVHSFMSYQISMSLSLLTLVAISFACRIEAPYTVIQLLFINILADGPPAQSLGMERVDESDLQMKPRNVHQPILSCQLIGRTLTLTTVLLIVNGALYLALLTTDQSTIAATATAAASVVAADVSAVVSGAIGVGGSQSPTATVDSQLNSHDRALLFTCFVFSSIFATISMRSRVKTIFELPAFGNLQLFYCGSIVIAIQMLILNVGLLNQLFEVSPLPFLELFYLFFYSSTVLAFMDLAKLVVRFTGYLGRRADIKARLDDLSSVTCGGGGGNGCQQ